MTSREDKIQDRLRTIIELVDYRHHNGYARSPTYVFYADVLNKLKNVIAVMKSYGMDPDIHKGFDMAVAHLVVCIEKESRIEATDIAGAAIGFFDSLGLHDICMTIYNLVDDTRKPLIVRMLPSHLQTAVILMK